MASPLFFVYHIDAVFFYRLPVSELNQIRGCDSTEDLGIDDCSTDPSLPTACPVDGTADEGSDLKSAIRFFLNVSNEPRHPVN